MATLSPEIAALLERLDTEELDSATTMQLARRPHVLDELIAFAQSTRPDNVEEHRRMVERQRKVVPVIIDLGRVRIPPQDIVPERLGPIVTDPKVVEFLVEQLVSLDSGTRHMAFVAVAELVPATLLTPHSEAIRGAVKRFPAEDGAILVLGKTADRAPALALLRESAGLESANRDNAIMVRARLGDAKAEEALLRAYHDTNDAEERGALALRLGYAATPRLVGLLAQEIRSPKTYVWNQRSRRSLRVHVIAGLHLAFPTEPLFWKPFFRPGDDSYYAAIEAWLTKHLGTTWSGSRPEFLYEESAPTQR